MSIQNDSGTTLAYKKKTTGDYGALPGASGATYLRNIDSTFALKKSAIESKEKRSDQQVSKPRHGMRQSSGNVTGHLSTGTYADFIASCLRRDFAAVASLSALTNVTASATAPQFVRASGSWITDGLRVGMVVRCAGWATTGTANNAKNFTITALTATDMTVAETVAAKASGDSVVVSIPGKVTYVPATGHTKDEYVFEYDNPDADLTLLSLGQRVSSIEFDLMPDDNIGITITFMGQDTTADAATYFTSVAAETTTTILTGLSGGIYLDGIEQGTITSFKLKIDNKLSTGKTFSNNVTPDVFYGSTVVDGSMTVYLENDVIYNKFDAETAISTVIRIDESDAVNCPFVAIAIPDGTIADGSLSKDNNARTISFNFKAGRGLGTNGWRDTTIQIQDSGA